MFIQCYCDASSLHDTWFFTNKLQLWGFRRNITRATSSMSALSLIRNRRASLLIYRVPDTGAAVISWRSYHLLHTPGLISQILSGLCTIWTLSFDLQYLHRSLTLFSDCSRIVHGIGILHVEHDVGMRTPKGRLVLEPHMYVEAPSALKRLMCAWLPMSEYGRHCINVWWKCLRDR